MEWDIRAEIFLCSACDLRIFIVEIFHYVSVESSQWLCFKYGSRYQSGCGPLRSGSGRGETWLSVCGRCERKCTWAPDTLAWPKRCHVSNMWQLVMFVMLIDWHWRLWCCCAGFFRMDIHCGHSWRTSAGIECAIALQSSLRWKAHEGSWTHAMC